MTTFTASVAASTDDAQETSGTNTTNSANLNANGPAMLTGLRFTGVTIPAGSSISAAYLILTITSASYDDPDVTIRASGEANPAAFTTDANHLTNRAKSSASVDWNADNVGTGAQNTPSLTTIVQESIDQGGWSSGNALAFYIIGKTGSALRFNAYDNGSGQPQLSITYTPPAASGAHAKLSRVRLSTRVGGLLV